MSPSVYDVGDLIEVSAIFTNVAGDAIDPSVVIFAFKDPAGAKTTYTYGTNNELVKDSVGNYHVNVSVDSAGTWYYRWSSTGEGQAAEEDQFVVRASNI